MTSDRRSPIVEEQEKTTGRPRARAAQAAVFRLVNVPRRVLLGLPSSTPMAKRLMLVHHIGPVTGKRYRQPVSYVPDGDTLLTPGGGRWTRNLRDGEPTRIRLRGKDVTVRPDLIADPAEIERLLRIMTIANPALKRFIPIPKTPDGRLDPASLALAIQYGFRIVRWHLDQEVPDHGKPVPNQRSTK